MKKTEIALLILIVSISMLTAYFIGNAVLGQPKDKTAEVEVAEPIQAEVKEPNKKIFNVQAINPTVQITIGQPSNQQPFNGN